MFSIICFANKDSPHVTTAILHVGHLVGHRRVLEQGLQIMCPLEQLKTGGSLGTERQTGQVTDSLKKANESPWLEPIDVIIFSLLGPQQIRVKHSRSLTYMHGCIFFQKMLIFPKLPYRCIRTEGLFFPGNIIILLGFWEIFGISSNFTTIVGLKPLISPSLSHKTRISSLEFLIYPKNGPKNPYFSHTLPRQ